MKLEELFDDIHKKITDVARQTLTGHYTSVAKAALVALEAVELLEQAARRESVHEDEFIRTVPNFGTVRSAEANLSDRLAIQCRRWGVDAQDIIAAGVLRESRFEAMVALGLLEKIPDEIEKGADLRDDSPTIPVAVQWLGENAWQAEIGGSAIANGSLPHVIVELAAAITPDTVSHDKPN